MSAKMLTSLSQIVASHKLLITGRPSGGVEGHKQTAASNMTDVAVTDQDPRPEEQISDRQQELLLIAVALHSNDLL